MPLKITDEQRSMIAGAVVAGGYCDHDHTLCLCCSPDAGQMCAMIVGAEYADALCEWVYEALGCGYHNADIRRGELGMELVGEEREAELLSRVAELDELQTLEEHDASYDAAMGSAEDWPSPWGNPGAACAR